MPKTRGSSDTKLVSKKKPAVSLRAKTTVKKASSTSKKAVTKSTKSVKPPKKTTTKTVKSIPVVKKSTKKTPLKTKVSPKKTAARKVKSPTPRTKDIVIELPARMSIRAREKVLVLAETFEYDFYPAAATAARFGGVSFLIIGAFTAFSYLHPASFNIPVCDNTTCKAELISSTATQNKTTDVAIREVNSAELLTNIPDVINIQTEIPVEITNVITVDAYIKFLTSEGQQNVVVPVSAIGNGKYDILIDPSELPAANYDLKIKVKHDNQTSFIYYTLGTFFVAPKQTSQPVLLQPETQPSVETRSEITPVLDNQATTTKLADKDVLKVDTPIKEIANEPVIEKKASVAENQSVVEQKFSIAVDSQHSLSNNVSVSLKQPTEIKKVTLYLRPIQGLNSQSVDTSTSELGVTKFNSRQYPNGTYELYAQGFSDDVAELSNSLRITIDNTFSKEAVTAPTLDVERSLLQITSVLPERNTAVTEDNEEEDLSESSNKETVQTPIKERALEKLTNSTDELDMLFQAYAVAQQTGNASLINEAEQAIQTYRSELVSDALSDDNDKFIARELDDSLRVELEELKKKVRTFETIRRDRTESDSSIDTDGDGISDVDERALYNTNPLAADSDNDGFTDGAEIIGGFNPLDAKAEASIVYESPKEAVGVVTTEKLQVVTVEPDVEISPTKKDEPVQTKVTGRGLPNSFVTLYVFSTPTIVTVRTESDGSFEYTFSKELEDGEHQVFVALTNNTGEIIAQSEPFTFIKEAQAFTPVDAQSNILEIAPTQLADGSPYRVALAMSVLALGIILILLGVGLRANKPDELVVTNRS
jgi:hypothetical protein